MVNLNRLKPAKIFANYPTDRGVIVDRICKLGDNRITLKGKRMTKSETLMSQLNMAESLIVRATQLVQKVVDADQVGDGVSAGAGALRYVGYCWDSLCCCWRTSA